MIIVTLKDYVEITVQTAWLTIGHIYIRYL